MYYSYGPASPKMTVSIGEGRNPIFVQLIRLNVSHDFSEYTGVLNKWDLVPVNEGCLRELAINNNSLYRNKTEGMFFPIPVVLGQGLFIFIIFFD